MAPRCSWSSATATTTSSPHGPASSAAKASSRTRSTRFAAVSRRWRDEPRSPQHRDALGAAAARQRSEERRVGKEGVSTCKTRGSPDYQKKNYKKNTIEH